MAQQEFYLSAELIGATINELVGAGWKIASHADQSTGEIKFISSSSSLSDLKNGQLLIKHKSFSNMDFCSKRIR